MIYLLLIWIFSSLLLLATAALVPGFKINSFGAALAASLVLGLLNAFLRPFLLFLSLPLNILTLGLFTFVVNAIILRLTAGTLPGFTITGWLPAILAAIVLAILHALFFAFARYS
jgi:putative membrane protein